MKISKKYMAIIIAAILTITLIILGISIGNNSETNQDASSTYSDPNTYKGLPLLKTMPDAASAFPCYYYNPKIIGGNKYVLYVTPNVTTSECCMNEAVNKLIAIDGTNKGDKSSYHTFECWAKNNEILVDTNLNIRYFSQLGSFVYEVKYDGKNYRKEPAYSNWDDNEKMYYKTVTGYTITAKNSAAAYGYEAHTEHPLWNKKYVKGVNNLELGYWKIDYKEYTDGKVTLINEYVYERDTTIDLATKHLIFKKFGVQ